MTTRQRDPYLEVGQAVRRAISSARSAGATPAETDVVLAIVELVSSWSHLDDRILLADLAEAAGRHPKTVSKALRRFAALGIVTYEPGRIRTKSLIGFPRAAAEGVSSGSLSHAGEGVPRDSLKRLGEGAQLGRQEGAQLGSQEGAPGRSPSEEGPENPYERAAVGKLIEQRGELDALLAPLGTLYAGQRQRAAAAFERNPAFVRERLRAALADGKNPAALFDSMLREVPPAHLRLRGTDERVTNWLVNTAVRSFDDESDVKVILEDNFRLPRAQVDEGVAQWRRLREALPC